MNEEIDLLKELQLAKSLVIKWLSRRSFFQAEIEYKLQKSGISSVTIKEVILFCRKLNILDDEKLKEKIIEKELRRGRGVMYAYAKCGRWLKGKEMEEKDLKRAELEKEAIEKILQKKKVDLPSLDPKEKRKLCRFFLQRGFQGETIQRVLFEFEF